MLVRFLGQTCFSFYTIVYIGLTSSRTKSHETGTVLALYTATLSGIVNMLAAPVSGPLFDACGACPLCALAATACAIGALILRLVDCKQTIIPHVKVVVQSFRFQ